MKLKRVLPGLALAAGAVFGAAWRVASAPADPELEAKADAIARSGPWRHNFATVNGVRLHYAELGEGPLVVLLHGFPECWYMWHNILPRLGTRFHVVALDMRGYNWSDKPKGVSAYSSEEVARDVSALIEHLGDTQAYVVGHDWGGAIAWQLSIQSPERIKKLVIINAPHPTAVAKMPTLPKQLLRSYYIFFFQLPILPEAVVRLLIGQMLSNSTYTPGAFSEETLDVFRNNVNQPGTATAMINYYRAAIRSAPANMKRRIPPIEVPTMIIWGTKDFALTEDLLHISAAQVANLCMERVEDSGHWVPEEKPRVVSDLLLDYLGSD
jgi:pimeloyl-ACP methyl ester carboxylesterase